MSYTCERGLFCLWLTAVPQDKCLIIFPLGETRERVKKHTGGEVTVLAKTPDRVHLRLNPFFLS